MLLQRLGQMSNRFWAGLVLASLVFCISLGFITSDRGVVGQDARPTAKDAKSKLSPAKNPTQLIVLVEPGKLLGWISGTSDRTGASVKLMVSGKPAEEVKVEPGNTFTWKYSTPKEMRADVQVGDLRQTVTIYPTPKTGQSVFFVLDRLVFRPGQTMNFAGFLREMDADGEFKPVPKKEIEVALTSEKKKTAAKKWKLTSDEAGRITADYKFADADPIDAYTLNIAGVKGGAKVELAEYRKLTSSFAINGQLEGGKLRVQFEARDYTGETVPAEKVQLTTQIVPLIAAKETGELNPAEFAHASPVAPNQPRPDALSEDEQLLAQFQSGPLSYGTTPFAVLHEVKSEKKITGKGKGEIEVVVPDKWKAGRYSAIVEAVLTDAAGRELRAFQMIPLDGSDNTLRLQVAKSVVSVDEPIEVKASTNDPASLKGSGSLVAFKLNPVAPITAIPYYYPYPGWSISGYPPSTFMGISGTPPSTTTMGFSGSPGSGISGFGGSLGVPASYMGMHGYSGMSGPFPGMGFPGSFGGCFGSFSCIPTPPKPPTPTYPFPRVPAKATPKSTAPAQVDVGPFGSIERKFATAAAFQGDTATLRLTEPGAYKFVVVWNHTDGRKWQQEAGVVVRGDNEVPGLQLDLKKENFESTEPLEGTIRSRFYDARVLLSLRDSSGFRWAKTVRLRDGKAAFKEELPKDIRYGACIEAVYADVLTSVEPAYHVSKYLRIVPRDRMIGIKLNHKEEVEPGSKVEVNIDVNRKEEVDLIVSVFDRSLLDVHGGKPVDIRNFYLADDRIRETQTRDTLRRQLAGVTIYSLAKRADTIRKTLPKDSPDLAILDALIKNYPAGRLSLDDVAALLRLAGFHARNLVINDGKAMPEIRFSGSTATLLQVLDQTVGGWTIHVASFYDTLLIAGTHPRERPDPFAVPPPAQTQPYYYRWPNPMYPGGHFGISGGMGMGGMSMMGMGGMSGFNGFPSSPGIGGGASTGFQGYYSHVPQLVAVDPKQPQVIKIPGGLDNGEAWLRRDFSDIAYWNAAARTDANGKAKVEFKLPDSLTSWEVRVTAVSKQMHVGSNSSVIKAVKPIMVQPILPRIFVEGDEVMVSAIIHNRSGAKQAVQVKLETKNGKILSPVEEKLELDDKGQGAVTWKFKAGETGYSQLLLSASCVAGKDASLKRLPVIRAGAEQIVNWSGYAKGQATVELPEGANADDAKLELTFAPSLAADLVDTLNYLVEYPYGCVEQTMSRFLPAVKVAQLLKIKKIENDALMKKLPGCVEGGIKRLLELQQPDGGWGWNGTSSTHEMMTPYALFGLIEAEKAGYTIPSKDAIPRGLERLKKYIDSLGKAQTADRIYCLHVWSLKNELKPAAWEFIDEQLEAKALTDYAAALALETAVRQVRTKLADRLAQYLRDRAVNQDGLVSWQTAGFSRWADDRFEITAAAMKALVAYDKDDPLLPKVVDYFARNKRGNRWNSTKDTAMIVYAMCDYLEKLRDDSPDAAKVIVRVNDGEPIEVTPDTKNQSKLLSIPGKQLRAGKNVIRFEKSPAGMLARASLRYMHSGKDLKPVANGITVERRMYLRTPQGFTQMVRSGDTVPKGSYVFSSVVVDDRTKGGMSYLLVESGIPSGAEVMPADDKRFPAGGSAYVLREVREDKVAFHHESTMANVQDHCVLHMEMAGEFTFPPARAELMYDSKRWGHSGSFTLKVE
jgi:Alpha-2-macroglobulin family/Bacterial Alpha-2-macroglobulin MG10 domain/A-macroglobulin TED domain